MFPTRQHAITVFSAFDIYGHGYLSPSELQHALQAVGLGDAPKQIVYGIIRQTRHEGINLSLAAHPNGHAERLAPPVSLASASVASPKLASVPPLPVDPSGVATAVDVPALSSTAPIVMVTLEEFLAVIKELSPPARSSEATWKGFKCLDVNQQGRVSLDVLIAVARREEEKLVGKLLMGSSRPGLGMQSSLARDEMSLRHLVEHAAEYRDKGVAFDEWKQAISHA